MMTQMTTEGDGGHNCDVESAEDRTPDDTAAGQDFERQTTKESESATTDGVSPLDGDSKPERNRSGAPVQGRNKSLSKCSTALPAGWGGPGEPFPGGCSPHAGGGRLLEQVVDTLNQLEERLCEKLRTLYLQALKDELQRAHAKLLEEQAEQLRQILTGSDAKLCSLVASRRLSARSPTNPSEDDAGAWSQKASRGTGNSVRRHSAGAMKRTTSGATERDHSVPRQIDWKGGARDQRRVSRVSNRSSHRAVRTSVLDVMSATKTRLSVADLQGRLLDNMLEVEGYREKEPAEGLKRRESFGFLHFSEGSKRKAERKDSSSSIKSLRLWQPGPWQTHSSDDKEQSRKSSNSVTGVVAPALLTATDEAAGCASFSPRSDATYEASLPSLPASPMRKAHTNEMLIESRMSPQSSSSIDEENSSCTQQRRNSLFKMLSRVHGSVKGAALAAGNKLQSSRATISSFEPVSPTAKPYLQLVIPGDHPPSTLTSPVESPIRTNTQSLVDSTPNHSGGCGSGGACSDSSAEMSPVPSGEAEGDAGDVVPQPDKKPQVSAPPQLPPLQPLLLHPSVEGLPAVAEDDSEPSCSPGAVKRPALSMPLPPEGTPLTLSASSHPHLTMQPTATEPAALASELLLSLSTSQGQDEKPAAREAVKLLVPSGSRPVGQAKRKLRRPSHMSNANSMENLGSRFTGDDTASNSHSSFSDTSSEEEMMSRAASTSSTMKHLASVAGGFGRRMSQESKLPNTSMRRVREEHEKAVLDVSMAVMQRSQEELGEEQRKTDSVTTFLQRTGISVETCWAFVASWCWSLASLVCVIYAARQDIIKNAAVLPLALGALIGKWVLHSHSINGLVGPVQQPLAKYAFANYFDEDLNRRSSRIRSGAMAAWICCLLLRLLVPLMETYVTIIRPSSACTDDALGSDGAWQWRGLLEFLAFGHVSGVYMSLVYCQLHVLVFLELMLDSFCATLFETTDLKQCVFHWNVLQAMLRRSAQTIEACFLAVQTSALMAIALNGWILLQETRAECGWAWTTLIPEFISILMLSWFTLFTLFKAAAVTEKCQRVPSLVNSLPRKDPIDVRRQYAVQYIMNSAAGFYVQDVRLTTFMALKIGYICAAACFALVVQLFRT
eukprot:TRINITY_DN20231_c0_g2_i1.p1 TRINITY_DN20231_c0_g2~~TRINITY_DN20231_c0_g2_i1.p1  ORF type:complete len:1122 (+),score=196.91 TRINITY_DN20231_c0_g2_i1:129-3494(+)